MKIELKKLKISEHMSEETTAFTAEIYVNGVNAGYAKNHGHGGCTDYHAHEGKRSLIEQAEKYCLGLPPIVYPAVHGMKGFEVPSNLENFIDNIVDEKLRTEGEKKLQKKLAKKMVNCLMFGPKNHEGSYYEVKFRIPLAQMSKDQLQGLVDKYKAQIALQKPEYVLWNTNLKDLGINL
jgi:hypothetical protein